jgi:hypothetical protein
MAEPIVFISRNRIKEDKINEFRNHYRDRIPMIFEEKLGTLAQLAYLNEEDSEVIIIRLFPSTEALDLQIQGADERSKKTYELIEPLSIEIFGKPTPATLERVKIIAGKGIPVSISPHYIDGFIR